MSSVLVPIHAFLLDGIWAYDCHHRSLAGGRGEWMQILAGRGFKYVPVDELSAVIWVVTA
ncbi:MAG: hypothetical protein JWP55_3346, partial [Mycobacterium sp.]|nr:hypothetical protein [Mycobacterium sp.]